MLNDLGIRLSREQVKNLIKHFNFLKYPVRS